MMSLRSPHPCPVSFLQRLRAQAFRHNLYIWSDTSLAALNSVIMLVGLLCCAGLLAYLCYSHLASCISPWHWLQHKEDTYFSDGLCFFPCPLKACIVNILFRDAHLWHLHLFHFPRESISRHLLITLKASCSFYYWTDRHKTELLSVLFMLLSSYLYTILTATWCY